MGAVPSSRSWRPLLGARADPNREAIISTPFPGNFIWRPRNVFYGGVLTNVQRALIRHGYGSVKARGYYGSATRDAIKDIQRRAHLAQTGNIGRRCWVVLDAYYLSATEKKKITTLVREQRQAEAQATAARRRAEVLGRIIDAAVYTVARASAIHYTQGPLRMVGVTHRIRLPDYPHYMDCSSGVTWLYWQAGAPDCNGRGYDGFGFTGTLAAHGKSQSPADIQPGDLVFYGPPPTFSHVACCIRDRGAAARVWSHGSESGPSYRQANYRTITGVRRYPLA